MRGTCYITAVSGDQKPILILGAGINGCAIARELLLNRVPVYLVETTDVAYGATAYSSRLIHGGLRYLEYGEFDLVRESLAERTRLLRLAPHLVRPLQLFIPVSNRFGGLLAALPRFLGWGEKLAVTKRRGVWLVRMGLWFYDRYARDPSLPRHAVYSSHERNAMPVDRRAFPWLCSYYDGQVRYPERFSLALLEDTRRLSAEYGVEFRVLMRHRARLVGQTVELCAADADEHAPAESTLEPAAIVNATGAWVDRTLARLPVHAQRMMGGTKGSHLVTSNEALRAALADRAIYAEAADGRPFFILPFGHETLIGTTDLPFDEAPDRAVATPQEIDYLIGSVNEILPDVKLSQADVDLHYSGVRPLPYIDQATPGAITRRHWLAPLDDAPLPIFSVIGGKLTTCRSLAEESVHTILARLGRPVLANSRERPLPGGEDYPRDRAALIACWEQLAAKFHLQCVQVESIWWLLGTRTEGVLAGIENLSADCVAGTSFPREFARWVIRHEFPRNVSDLVERRLMLLYVPTVSADTLRELATLLAEEGVIGHADIEPEIVRTIDRLVTHFGKCVQ
ncbi:MAG: glycerol-3-phosphate dehydrogenase/oxidase [Pirellulales bacterium]|nr:glycerol-3-phosphate dehydrogenase/oxidase [Pirellulales bacterium]